MRGVVVALATIVAHGATSEGWWGRGQRQPSYSRQPSIGRGRQEGRQGGRQGGRRGGRQGGRQFGGEEGFSLREEGRRRVEGVWGRNASLDNAEIRVEQRGGETVIEFARSGEAQGERGRGRGGYNIAERADLWPWWLGGSLEQCGEGQGRGHKEGGQRHAPRIQANVMAEALPTLHGILTKHLHTLKGIFVSAWSRCQDVIMHYATLNNIFQDKAFELACIELWLRPYLCTHIIPIL